MPSITSALSKIVQPRRRNAEKRRKSEESQPNGTTTQPNGEQKSVEEEEKETERELRKIEQKRGIEAHRKSSDESARRAETPEQRARYGNLTTLEYDPAHDTALRDISESIVGKEVHFRARLHTSRAVSSALVFLVFRQQTHTVQGVLTVTPDLITPHMVKWAEHLSEETILQVKGVVEKPVKPIIGATVSDAEVHIRELHVVSRVTSELPFTVYEDECTRAAEASDEETKFHVTDRARLNSRILDLRTPVSQSIFRVQSTICNAFRSYLDEQGFIEIHTPKLQGGASESGASVFRLKYFGRPAFLAQSPQLPKQMSIAADFQRVYEIGPVFRAENSNTHRHLTEYTGLDLEMTIQRNYYDVLKMVDSVLKNIFRRVYEVRRTEIEIIKEHFPHDDLVWLEETPIIKYSDGVQMLIDSGWKDEGNTPSPDEDLSTRAEIQLGELVKEKYHTDYYILDKFPTSVRPFYTMPDPENKSVTNSFDIFLRGQEIVTGGQRIHDAQVLEENMAKFDVKGQGIEEYLEGFEWGAPPHGGCGIGLERLVMLMLGLRDIRYASMYPRDPKSLPQPPESVHVLPHPEASTLLKDVTRRKEGVFVGTTTCMCKSLKESDDSKELHPPLEKLIANYGDAANTSWLDPRYEIWRHEPTGAAVGFSPSSHGFAMIIGNPLCDISQYAQIAPAFLRWLKNERKLKPVWLLVNEEMEKTLGKMGWSTMTCVGESRVELKGELPRALEEKEVARKIRHAQNTNVVIKFFGANSPLTDEIKKKCEKRIEEWKNNRKGKQVRLTLVEPWKDEFHREYFVAIHKNSEGEEEAVALVVLAQLAPINGWQVKYALDFPSSPSGSIELALSEAMKNVAKSNTGRITFGTSAMDRLIPRENMSGIRVRILAQAYQAISDQLKLLNKGDFRTKLGAEVDPVYICYPHRHLGNRGAKSILDFFMAGEGTDGA